jgi:Rrf2 family protein
MMAFSQTLGYAVQVLACLDVRHPRKVDEIGAMLTVPKPYLRKVVKRMAEEGFVHTRRGRRGGVVLSRPPETISLLQLIKAVEGTEWIAPCLLSMETCAALRFCPLKGFWTDIKKRLETKLRVTSLKEVIGARSPDHSVRGDRPVRRPGRSALVKQTPPDSSA